MCAHTNTLQVMHTHTEGTGWVQVSILLPQVPTHTLNTLTHVPLWVYKHLLITSSLKPI